jgi:hypothetical protein
MQWEYLVFTLRGYPREQVKDLNDQGADGWELIAVSDEFAYLKRPRQGQPDANRLMTDVDDL